MLELTEEQIATMSYDDMVEAIGESFTHFVKAKMAGTLDDETEQDSALAGLMYVCMAYTAKGVPSQVVDSWFETWTGTSFELKDGLFTVTIDVADGATQSIGIQL